MANFQSSTSLIRLVSQLCCLQYKACPGSKHVREDEFSGKATHIRAWRRRGRFELRTRLIILWKTRARSDSMAKGELPVSSGVQPQQANSQYNCPVPSEGSYEKDYTHQLRPERDIIVERVLLSASWDLDKSDDPWSGFSQSRTNSSRQSTLTEIVHRECEPRFSPASVTTKPKMDKKVLKKSGKEVATLQKHGTTKQHMKVQKERKRVPKKSSAEKIIWWS